MDMTGEYRIGAARETVWRALNDPAILKQVIPGCDEIAWVSDTELTAKIGVKIGPLSAHFSGKIVLSDLNPPGSYTISGEGQGGIAGFAKGSARVRLIEDGAYTLLSYQAQAHAGGKLAKIGSRLIGGAARKIADDFFARFAALVATAPAAGAAQIAATPAATSPASPAAIAENALASNAPDRNGVPQDRRLPPLAWVSVLTGLIAVILYLFVGD